MRPWIKNQAKAGDPEMHRTKKGHTWHFGMKAHVGVSSDPVRQVRPPLVVRPNGFQRGAGQKAQP
jgi:hypothetical protein